MKDWRSQSHVNVVIIPKYRRRKGNLRTQLTRIVKRAGLKPWPKIWQNLRSTRETELAEQFPMHVVCEWIGNTQPVAMKHYLQVTDEHYELAAGGTLQKAVHNPAKQTGTAGKVLNTMPARNAKFSRPFTTR